MGLRGLVVLALVSVAACGDEERGSGGTSSGDASDGDDGSATSQGDDAQDDGAVDGGAEGSGSGGGADGDDGVDATAAPVGDCELTVALALDEDVGLEPMTVEAIRREFMDNDIPLYLVQVHGSEAGTNRLDIAFGGMPIAGTTYEASGEPGGVVDTPVIGLFPSTAEGTDFVEGTVTYASVGVLEGELLVMQLDLAFAGGTITGCIAQPIVVEFTAPP